LTEKYRSSEAFSPDVFERSLSAIQRFGVMSSHVETPIRLNKATFYSWLWFLSDTALFMGDATTPAFLGRFLSSFERAREAAGLYTDSSGEIVRDLYAASNLLPPLLSLYNDRSSARVADVSSVLTRDAVIWIFMGLYCRRSRVDFSPPMPKALAFQLPEWGDEGSTAAYHFLEELISIPEWGRAL
jgi:hypothetical protein